MKDSTFSQDSSSFHRYAVYGVTILSELPLPLRETPLDRPPDRPEDRSDSLCKVEIRAAGQPVFATLDEEPSAPIGTFTGFHFAQMADRSTYVRWDSVGEAMISGDGRSIMCRPYPQSEPESFHVYLLGQALSFALVKQGFEPLHATAVAVGDQAVAFVGDCGFGKSTLAGSFLEAGHRLVTDDLLLLQHTRRGIVAHPGAARLKLFPRVAHQLLGHCADSVPLNPYTGKQIIPLDGSKVCTDPVPLRAIYSLAPASKAKGECIRIAPLSKRDTFVVLLGAAFNRTIVDSERLQRQFHTIHAIAGAVTVKKAFYPRILSSISRVREAIISDLCAEKPEILACEA